MLAAFLLDSPVIVRLAGPLRDAFVLLSRQRWLKPGPAVAAASRATVFTQLTNEAAHSGEQGAVSHLTDFPPAWLGYEGFPLVALENFSGIEQKTLIIAC